MKKVRLARTTPLESHAELTRSTPMRRTTGLKSSGPTKAKRRDTGPTEAVKEVVRARAQHCCEFCGMGGGRMDIHHLRPRGLGGTSDPAANLPSNLVLLHRHCHLHIESNRTWALLHGWLVHQQHDPALAPIVIRGRKVLLDDLGGVHPVDHQEAS